MSDPRKSESHRRTRTRLAAFLVAALTVGVGLLIAAPTWVPSEAKTVPAVGGSPQGSRAATSAPVATSATVPWAGWTASMRSTAYADAVRGGTAGVAAVLAAHGYSTASAPALYRWLLANPQAIFTTDDLGQLESGLEAAGVGCAAGGVIGAIAGGPVGAGIGCGVGAVALLLTQDYFASSAGGIALRQEDALDRAQGTAFTNYYNITSATTVNYLSAFNSTLYAWENAADAAAVSQIGNSSFNYDQDLAMSFVGYQFDSMIYPTFAQTSVALQQLDRVVYSIYSVNGLTTYDYYLFGDGACLGGGSCSPQYYGGTAVVQTASGGTSGTLISILKNETFSIGCSAGQYGSLVDARSNTVVERVSNNSSTTGNVIFANWSGASGAYLLYGSASASTGCSITGTGIIVLPRSPLAGTVGSSGEALWCGHTKQPGTCNPLLHPIVVGSQPDSETLTNTSCNCAIQPSFNFLGGVTLAYKQQFSSMLESIESNAYTYWSYLRTLGYTSVSQIPSGCIIPYPNLATPTFVTNNQAVSINATEALYGAMLNSLATFFDTPPSVTTFCHGHTTFTFGSGSGPILGENITGFVLSLPLVGTHQRWKSPHTWAINGSNPGITAQESIVGSTNATPTGLTLWPTVTTVKIPLNTIVYVAGNNPLDLFDSQTFTQAVLYGNGTAQPSAGTLGDIATTTNPGVSLYLTTCSINGINENPCVLNYTVLTTDIGNLSCFPDCSTGSGLTILIPSVCAGNVPVLGPLAAGLAGSLSSVPFIGGAACDIAWAVVLVITLVVVIVAVYVVVWIVRGRD